MVKRIIGLAALTALLAGTASAQSRTSRTVTIGLGYLPNVQFAPFYVAEQQGYFRREGVEVRFQHGFVSELMPLLLQGKLDFVVGDPEDAIFARVQGAPVKYVMAVYQKLPATLFSLPAENINAANDLRGRTIGIPGAFGSSYYALQAYLKANRLSERDVRLAPIGFTQLEAVRAGRVDAAVGFVNNEVVQLRASGVRPNTLDLTKAYPMVGAGLITTEKTLSDPVARRVVRAAQRGVAFTVSNTTRAHQIATTAAYAGPSGGSIDVLRASVDLMKSSGVVGTINPRNWGTAVGFLQTNGQVPGRFKASDFYDTTLLDRTVR